MQARKLTEVYCGTNDWNQASQKPKDLQASTEYYVGTLKPGESKIATTTYWSDTVHSPQEIESIEVYRAKTQYVEAISGPAELLGAISIFALLVFVLVSKGIASGERRVTRQSEAREYEAKCEADAKIAIVKLEMLVSSDE